jgi:hypothetical protein
MESRAVRKRLEEKKIENVDKDKDEAKEKNEKEGREKSFEDGGSREKEREDDEDMELEEDEDTVVENVDVTYPTDVTLDNCQNSPGAKKYLPGKSSGCPRLAIRSQEEDRISLEDRAHLLARDDLQRKSPNRDKWKSNESDHHHCKHEGSKNWPKGSKGSGKASSSKRRMFSCRERPPERDDDKSSTS